MNKVQLMGVVGGQPVQREDGVLIKLATVRADGATEWHPVLCRGECSEVALRLAEGDLLVVHGSLRTSEYMSPDGNRRWMTDVVCEMISATLRAEA